MPSTDGTTVSNVSVFTCPPGQWTRIKDYIHYSNALIQPRDRKAVRLHFCSIGNGYAQAPAVDTNEYFLIPDYEARPISWGEITSAIFAMPHGDEPVTVAIASAL